MLDKALQILIQMKYLILYLVKSEVVFLDKKFVCIQKNPTKNLDRFFLR